MTNKSAPEQLLRLTPVPRNVDDVARSHVDDALLEAWEKRLKLESPDHQFRQAVWMAVAYHLCVPNGGLGSVSRKGLVDAKKYWHEVQTCLSCLLDLLPREEFREHPQARLMRIELIGKAPEEEQSLKARELFQQRSVLEDWLVIANAQELKLSKERIPPNVKLGADRMLVSQLAGIFRERTGKDPREHIRGNNEKNAYSGDFFEFAKPILRKVGNRQSDAALGDMIKDQLRKV